MRKSTRSAFTLVELIVVITILAVLGTIGFMSMQGYSADARNTKRTSDLNNISSAMNIKTSEGVALKAFIKPLASAQVSPSSYGWADSTANDYYAGTPNYTVLAVKEADFKDPTDSEYRIGLTTTNGGKYELAASIEGGANKEALVKGTFSAREAATTGTVESVTDSTVTLTSADAFKFAKGDVVTFSTKGDLTIQNVNRDWITITLWAGHGVVAAETVALKADETKGLIADKTDASKAVVNGSSTYLPY